MLNINNWLDTMSDPDFERWLDEQPEPTPEELEEEERWLSSLSLAEKEAMARRVEMEKEAPQGGDGERE